MSKNSTKVYDPLTQEQIVALDSFQKSYGKQWKQSLSNCWMNSAYPKVSQDEAAALQKLRNTHGPKWLVDFK